MLLPKMLQPKCDIRLKISKFFAANYADEKSKLSDVVEKKSLICIHGPMRKTYLNGLMLRIWVKCTTDEPQQMLIT